MCQIRRLTTFKTTWETEIGRLTAKLSALATANDQIEIWYKAKLEVTTNSLNRQMSEAANAKTVAETKIVELERNLEAADIRIAELVAAEATAKAELDELLTAATRFCSQAKSIYTSDPSMQVPGWDGDLQKDSGSYWYWNQGNNNVKVPKPTVEQWIKFANEVAEHAEAHSGEWQKARTELTEMEHRRLDRLENAVNATADRNVIARMFLAHIVMSIKAALALQDKKDPAAIQDQLLLGLFENLPLINKLVEEDRKRGLSGANLRNGVGAFMICTGGSTSETVTAALKGLRDHRSGEVDKIIASLPSDLGLQLARDILKLGH